MKDSRNWAELPPELLVSIANRLPVPDYARFPAVCSSWAHSIRDLPPKPPSSSHFPWLALIPPNPSDFQRLEPVNFINRPEKHRMYQIPVAAAADDLLKSYIGYRDGWLVVVLRDDSVLLVNPLTSATSRLPSIGPLFDDDDIERVDKVVISASPGSGSFVALIVLANHLAFARPGHSEWTPLHTLHHYIDDVDGFADEEGAIYYDVEVKDVVYHDGKFFVTFANRDLLSFDLSGPSPLPSVLISTGMAEPLWSHYSLDAFLVSAPSGDLLQVKKRNCKSKMFHVMRFDPELREWMKVDGLGGGGYWSLFLDRLGSVVLSGMPGLDGNHIFFQDSSISAFKVGVYDFGKGRERPSFRRILALMRQHLSSSSGSGLPFHDGIIEM